MQVTLNDGRIDLKHLTALVLDYQYGIDGADFASGRYGRGGDVKIRQPHSFFSRTAYQLAMQQWQSGPGQGWKDTPSTKKKGGAGS